LDLLTILLLLATCWASSPALGQDKKPDFEGLMNKLLAPGPLIKGHEDLEHKDCLECHEPGGGVPNTNCLSCHTEIGKQVKAGVSFHGRMQGRPCIDCHTDHKGRTFNTTYIDQEKFNHKLTGFILDGAHAKVKCEDCHTETRRDKPIRQNGIRYFGTKNSCISCHTDDDIHFFKGEFAKVECSECHSTTAWKPASKFNHKEKTGYALIGQHGRLSCNKCHAPNGRQSVKYDWPELPAKKCLSCHEDHHGNKLSPKFRNGRCDQCHNQERWNIAQFRHEVTGFPLRGQHARNRCVDCHKQPQPLLRLGKEQYQWAGLKPVCASCHEDYHGYRKEQSPRLGQLLKCDTCHTELGWKQAIRFNHNTQTRFPITGKHRRNSCFDCHVPQGSKRRGAKAKREKPLIPRTYHFPELSEKTCETCHKSPHSRAFHRRFKGAKCSSCHTTTGWSVVLSGSRGLLGGDRGFHKNTRFPLTGRHMKVPCKECHVRNGKETFRFPNASKKFCVTCHESVHKKQFHRRFVEKSCAECHTTLDFKRRKPFNHDTTRFKLTGKHAKIGKQCSECHKLTNKVLPTKPPRKAHQYVFPGARDGFCFNCHKNQHKDMFHPKFYRTPCYQCHTTSTFQKRKPFDHRRTAFPIRGKHRRNRCEDCHVPTRKRYKTPPFHRKGLYRFPQLEEKNCQTCHRDPHNGSRGQLCTKCHTEAGWQLADQFHRDFTLVGVHLTLGCDQCHDNDRLLKGTSEDCRFCHHNDDPHHGFLNNCRECHLQTFWQSTTFNHNMTLFPLVGSHRLTDCKSCHNQGVYQGLPTNCQDCHLQDALQVQTPNHNSSRYQQCEQCHNQFSFK
jgi:hypothetical protein